MILQRQKPITIWGTGNIGNRIEIRLIRTTDLGEDILASQAVSVDSDGNWITELSSQEAAYDLSMSITDGNSTTTFSDICIGEVWIAGGQSNMEYHVHFDKNKAEILNGPMNHRIRYFNFPQISIPEMEEKFDYCDFGIWRRCTPEDLPHFSSVAYYFVNDVSLSLDIPIGIVGCNWGGTPACAWIKESYLENTEGQIWLDEYNNKLEGLDIEKDKQNYLNHPNSDSSHPLKPIDGLLGKIMSPGLSEKEQAALVKVMFNNDTSNDPISGGPHHQYRPGGLYATMLTKIAPYNVRGVIWYQGESDSPHANVYHSVFSQLIQCWRDLWNEQLPFLFVQLAPFDKWLAIDGNAFPELRRQQQMVADNVENTWMTSSGDAGMETDIHPKEKKPIGQRLALLALNHIYHLNMLSEAPKFAGIEKSNNGIRIKFDHADGLYLDGCHINALCIEGQDGDVISYRQVSIDNDTLILEGNFEQKITIKFASTPYYRINLYNQAHIPATPFEVSI